MLFPAACANEFSLFKSLSNWGMVHLNLNGSYMLARQPGERDLAV